MVHIRACCRLMNICTDLKGIFYYWVEGDTFSFDRQKESRSQSVLQTLCILNDYGKLLERLLADRLTYEIEIGINFSKRQFVYIRGRSSVDDMKKIQEVTDKVKASGWRSCSFCDLVKLDIKDK